MKKSLKFFVLICLFILLSGLARWLELTLPPSFEYSNDFDVNKQVQKFDDISLGDGNYRLGFYIGKVNVIGEKNDGNYMLEYRCDNKIARKVKNLHIKKGEEVYYDDSNWHTMIFIDEFNIPNDINCHKFHVEITTEKNFSLFEKLKIENPITFYIRKSEYAAKFKKIMSQETKKFREKYPNDFHNVPIEPIEDSNATKQALLNALLKKDFERFQNLLSTNNLDVNVTLGEDDFRKQTQRTPLFYAAYGNDLDTVSYLLQHGASIHHKDFIKKTALQYAIESNATQTVEYLLDNGADINDACYVFSYDKKRGVLAGDRLTPLVFAIKHEYYDLFKILLEHGFRKTDLDCKGLDLGGRDSAFENAWKKVENIESKRDTDNPFSRDTHGHIYHHLYDMQYPLRFLKLYKEYGLKDEKYEKDYTKEWFEQYYKKCKTGIYGGKCIFLNDNNLTLEEFDIFKYYELVGLENRQENTKNQRNK